jgi:hypothetical protein
LNPETRPRGHPDEETDMDGNTYLITAVANERISSRIERAQAQRRIAKARRTWSARRTATRTDY